MVPSRMYRIIHPSTPLGRLFAFGALALWYARTIWLVEAHRKLEAAVLAAYGSPVTLTDEVL